MSLLLTFIWAGFGAAFEPLVLCSLFWKRTTLPGGVCGMAAGGIMVFVWKYLIASIGGVFGIYELLPAFLVSLFVIVAVSLCTKVPDQSVLDEFEAARGYAGNSSIKEEIKCRHSVHADAVRDAQRMRKQYNKSRCERKDRYSGFFAF